MARLLFILAICCSFISQIPDVLNAGIDGIFKLIWVLPLLYQLVISPKSYFDNQLIPYYLYVLFFTLYCLFMQLFLEKSYMGADLYNMAISTMITMVSYNFWKKNETPSLLNLISLFILLGGSMLAVVIFKDYWNGGSLLSPLEAFDIKNALSPILLCCGVATLTLYKPQKSIYRLISYGLVIIIMGVMILLRSRATYVSAIYILMYVIYASSNKRIKLWAAGLTAVVLVFFLTNAAFYDILFKDILVGGINSKSIDSVSSGRFTLISIVLTMIPNHPWIGNGNLYLDCMPIAMLAQYGIWGCLIVFPFLFYLLRKCTRLQKTGPVGFTAFLLFTAFLVNSLFEAQTPFGPGIKCFIMWMLFGFALAIQQKQKRETDDREGDRELLVDNNLSKSKNIS